MNELINWLKSLFWQTKDIPSPRVDIPAPYYDASREAFIAPTQPPASVSPIWISNSMEPLIDVGHAVLVSSNPEYLSALKVGSIIIYEQDNKPIIHSIIEIGDDDKGWFCVAQGLNNAIPDPWKIRHEQIKQVVIGVIFTPDFALVATGDD